jgi:hypothetical protein
MDNNYLIKGESLTAIADEVRELAGISDKLGLTDMTSNLGVAVDEIASQTELLAQAVAALDGKAAGGGGGNSELARQLINRTVTEVNDSSVTSIGEGAFARCSRLTSVSFQNVTAISSSAFQHCYQLTSVSVPNAAIIDFNAFAGCTHLTTASFPQVTTICSSAFYSCHNLKSLYLPGSSLCALSNYNAFTSTPIGGYSASTGGYGTIYVPASLLASYRTAVNWSYHASRFVAIDGVPFTFTIDDMEYQAEEGMTWSHWCDSTYNTIGLRCTNMFDWNVYVYSESDDLCVCDNTGTLVGPTDVIVSDIRYALCPY